MLVDIAKSFAQLSDPRLKRVMWRALFWSVLLFAFVVTVAWTVIAKTTFFDDSILEWITHFASSIGATFLAMLLFPGIISSVISLFLDEVAEAVDAKHFNDLPAARPSKFGEQLASGARVFALTIAANIAVLVISLFVPPAFPFVYYGLNGYVLGREYFELVALRRMQPGDVRQLRRRKAVNVWAAGVAIAALLSIPVVGWFMPVAATAFMVHVVERLRRSPA